MATPSQPMPQGGPPQQGGSPGGAPQGGPQIVQLIQVLAQASAALGKMFPAASEDVSEIQNRVQQIQAKVAQTQRPTQPQAPPI